MLVRGHEVMMQEVSILCTCTNYAGVHHTVYVPRNPQHGVAMGIMYSLCLLTSTYIHDRVELTGQPLLSRLFIHYSMIMI